VLHIREDQEDAAARIGLTDDLSIGICRKMRIENDMFVEKVKTAGLAHLSYVIGSGGDSAVIDPRRDCEIYTDIALRKGCQISRVFEKSQA
jgi:hypothetical protein